MLWAHAEVIHSQRYPRAGMHTHLSFGHGHDASAPVSERPENPRFARIRLYPEMLFECLARDDTLNFATAK